MTEPLPHSYQQIQDVLQILRRVHFEIGSLCKAAGATVGETKTGLLLATLAERQQDMAELLDTSQASADDKILTTWIQFVPNEQIEQQLQSMQATETGPDDLPTQVVKVQQAIAELIPVIEDESSSEGVNQFLQSLADREHAEAKFSSRAILGQDEI